MLLQSLHQDPWGQLRNGSSISSRESKIPCWALFSSMKESFLEKGFEDDVRVKSQSSSWHLGFRISRKHWHRRKTSHFKVDGDLCWPQLSMQLLPLVLSCSAKKITGLLSLRSLWHTNQGLSGSTTEARGLCLSYKKIQMRPPQRELTKV